MKAILDFIKNNGNSAPKPAHAAGAGGIEQSVSPITKPKAKVKVKVNRRVIRRTKTVINIRELDFVGSYSESPNNQYTIAWSDRDQETKHGGNRDSGHGTFVVIEDDVNMYPASVPRPTQGRIANNGTFVLIDSMFNEQGSRKLQSTFYAINKERETLIEQTFTAKLYSIGISDDGRHAACKCANSKTSDSSVIAFFDLNSGWLLWKLDLGIWPNEYVFDCHNQILTLIDIAHPNAPVEIHFSGDAVVKNKNKEIKMSKNNSGLSLSSQFYQQHLLMSLDQATPVYLTGMEVIEYLWPLNDLFRPFIHQIRTVEYNAKAEIGADNAIEAFSQNPVTETWANLSAGVWRVLLERHQQLIMLAMANQMEGNPVTVIPQGLPKTKILPGILLTLAHGMKLPYPVEDRSSFEVPAAPHDSTLLQH